MIVECEKCGGKFKLDDSKITEKGIKVRCSKCKHVFTVKKAQAVPDFSPESPASADDPFQDFSFSDDIDLGGEPEPPPKEQVESSEREPAPPPSPGKGFSMADDDEAPSAAPQSEPPPAAPASEAPSPDDFSDFDFDEESFDADAPSAPAPPEGDKEWGDVSLSDEMPQMPDEQTAPKNDFDFSSEPPSEAKGDESYGDFKFDNEGQLPNFDLGGKAGPDKPDQPEGFVRSATSSAPVRDELEASLDMDTEIPSPGAVAVPGEQPARPVIKHAPTEKSKTSFRLIGMVVIFLAILGGGLFYLNSEGTFTFSDLTSGNFGKLKDVPAIQSLLISLGMMEEPDTGTVKVVKGSVKVFTAQRDRGGSVLVVTGQVRNTFRKAKSFVQVEVKLFDENKNLIVSKTGYCDVVFDEEELATMDRQDIEIFMNGQTGRKGNNVNIQQGGVREFTVVFFVVPPNLDKYKVEVGDYIDADAL
jgi:predicted Zn finger-like uncharacterized protein